MQIYTGILLYFGSFFGIFYRLQVIWCGIQQFKVLQ